MKKYRFLALVMIVGLAMGSFSCSKDDEGDNGNNAGNMPGNVSVPDGKGVLVAIRLNTYTEIPGFGVNVTTVNAASAAFWESSPSSFVNVGTVKINDLPMDFDSNTKSYFSGQSTVGVLQYPPVKWEVAGSGSIPGFTKEVSATFPAYSGTLPATVTATEDLTISLSGQVANADSVFVGVFADVKSKFKIVSASTASVTFSKSDLSGLGTIRQVQVTPMKYLSETVSGTKFWFILQDSHSRTYNLIP